LRTHHSSSRNVRGRLDHLLGEHSFHPLFILSIVYVGIFIILCIDGFWFLSLQVVQLIILLLRLIYKFIIIEILQFLNLWTNNDFVSNLLIDSSPCSVTLRIIGVTNYTKMCSLALIVLSTYVSRHYFRDDSAHGATCLPSVLIHNAQCLKSFAVIWVIPRQIIRSMPCWRCSLCILHNLLHFVRPIQILLGHFGNVLWLP